MAVETYSRRCPFGVMSLSFVNTSLVVLMHVRMVVDWPTHLVPLIALFIHVPICSHKYSNIFSTNISPASLNKTTHLGTWGKLFVIYFEIGIVTEFFPPDGYFFLPSNGMETSCNTSLLFQPNRWKMLRHICHLKGWTKHVMLRKTFHLMRWNVCRILSI